MDGLDDQTTGLGDNEGWSYGFDFGYLGTARTEGRKVSYIIALMVHHIDELTKWFA